MTPFYDPPDSKIVTLQVRAARLECVLILPKADIMLMNILRKASQFFN